MNIRSKYLLLTSGRQDIQRILHQKANIAPRCNCFYYKNIRSRNHKPLELNLGKNAKIFITKIITRTSLYKEDFNLTGVAQKN